MISIITRWRISNLLTIRADFANVAVCVAREVCGTSALKALIEFTSNKEEFSPVDLTWEIY